MTPPGRARGDSRGSASPQSNRTGFPSWHAAARIRVTIERKVACLALSGALCLSVPLPADAQPLYRHLRLIAPAAPGGGWDQTARAMQVVVQKTGIATISSVENIPGAAGTIGLARFTGAERGNGDVVMVSGLIMLSATITHRSTVTLKDVTPIARLTAEYEVVVVPAASPFRSMQDLVAAFRRRPESISWGGGSAGGSDQILVGLIADAVGVSPRRANYIAFSGGGEAMSAILGGQVSVGVNGLAEFAAQIEAGTVRVLAISSGERLAGLAAPTLREQGIDIEFENWRSLVAPPGISPEDLARLRRATEAMVRSPEWHATLEQYRWMDRYLAGEELAAFVNKEEVRVGAILTKLGLGAQDRTTPASVRAYPLLVLGGLVLCAGAAGLQAFRAKSRPSPSVETAERPAGRPGWRAAGLVGTGGVLHLVLLERGGFVLASAVLFWFTARAFDESHPVRDAFAAAAVSIAAYLLFDRALQLTLPAGPVRWPF